MPRTEFSPHLELIRNSEVDPHSGPGSRKISRTKDELVTGHNAEFHSAEPQVRIEEKTNQDLEAEIHSQYKEAKSGPDLTRRWTTVAAVATLFGSSVLFSDDDLMAPSSAR